MGRIGNRRAAWIPALLLGLVSCGDGSGSPKPRTQLYPHIRLAASLTRPPLDPEEDAWRAAHNDLLMGRVRPDSMRAVNPSVRLFEYLNLMHFRLKSQAEAFATANGLDAEDFHLHYREDILHPYYPTTVLVPGYPPGVIPGWNPDPQPGDPPASAQSRRESRVPGVNGPDWHLANVADPGYRSFLFSWTVGLLRGTAWGGPGYATGPTEGVLVDESIYYPQFNIGYIDRSAEYPGLPLDETHPYALAYESFHEELVARLEAEFGPGTADCPNYGHTWWLTQPDRFSQNVQAATGWVYGQVWITDRGTDGPVTGGTRVVSHEADYQKGIVAMIRQARAGAPRILGAFDLAGGMAGTDRGRLYTLALYYLVHGPNTYYAYQSLYGEDPAHVSLWQWNPAVVADIGTPVPFGPGVPDFEGSPGTTEHVLLSSGPDPHNPSLTYRVLARRFSKGLVLAKMLPQGSVVDDRSATTHALGGAYRRVNGDGSAGPVVTEVTLRNNEGAVLIER